MLNIALYHGILSNTTLEILARNNRPGTIVTFPNNCTPHYETYSLIGVIDWK